MMMKILVTGGAGFIGSHLVRRILAGTGHEVVTVDKLTYAGNLAALGEWLGDGRHAFERVDVGDAAAMAGVFERHAPDAVMHLAAESHVDRSIAGAEDFIQTNIVGTYRLLEVALGYYRRLDAERAARFRFLQVSTDEVYGSLGPGEAGFGEERRYAPRSPYSASKAAADHLVRAWHETYGLPVVVTNGCNNYGPFQYPEKLIPVVILRCMRGEEIPVYGDGGNVRDWMHVADHCEALMAVLERGRVGETYHIGAAHELTNLALVRAICGVMDELRPEGRPHAELIRFVADRAGHDFRYAIDARKIREELGWVPRVGFEQGLRETVRWYVECGESVWK